MKRKQLFILLLAFSFFSINGNAQQVEAFAKLDTNAMMIGDQIGLTIGINLPKDFQVVWPAFADTVTGHVEIVKKFAVDTTQNKGQKVITQRLVVTSFDSGYYQLPSIRFAFKRKNDTALYSLETNPMSLTVNVPQVDTTKAIKPIVAPLAEPVTFMEVFPYILGGLLALALIAFAIYYFKRRKAHQPVFARKPKPLPPPHVEAIEKLEELRLAKLWQSGKLKAYHSAITDIMRVYLKRRYGFDAVEMTSDDIFEHLANQMTNEQALAKLKQVFSLADFVKFAKARPTALENDQSIYDCIDFVNETKFIPDETKGVEEEQTTKEKEEEENQ